LSKPRNLQVNPTEILRKRQQLCNLQNIIFDKFVQIIFKTMARFTELM
jgi:hypothetical protein